MQILYNLNEEFNNKAIIPGQVSLIYYPVSKLGPFPHAQIEIEGICYIMTIRSYISDVTIDSKICKALNGGKAFGRIILNVTPRQLSELKHRIHGKRIPSSCMVGISDLLFELGHIEIPYGIRYSPSLSFLYLLFIRSLGEKRVGKLIWYQTSYGGINRKIKTLGEFFFTFVDILFFVEIFFVLILVISIIL